MSEIESGLQITLLAESAGVALVRHAIAGLAESVGMGEEAVADLKTVVTEACMNAVVHAYPDGEGVIEIEAGLERGSFVVVVRDGGQGIQPRIDTGDTEPGLRIGLPLIAALCSSFQISGGVDRGTEITMRLALPQRSPAGAEAGSATDENKAAIPAAEQLPGEVRIAATRPELLGPVLPRAVGAFGSRRDLSVDQLADATLLADAISAGAPASFGDEKVTLALLDGDGGIDLRVGPLSPGGGARLRDGMTVPEVGGSVESLADQVRVEQASDGEYVVFRIAPTH